MAGPALSNRPAYLAERAGEAAHSWRRGTIEATATALARDARARTRADDGPLNSWPPGRFGG